LGKVRANTIAPPISEENTIKPAIDICRFQANNFRSKGILFCRPAKIITRKRNKVMINERYMAYLLQGMEQPCLWSASESISFIRMR
jgi:hypothetical protein